MNVQVIVLVNTLVSLGFVGYSLSRISRRARPHVLFWVFILYISTAFVFGGIYYGIYARYINTVASLLEEPTGKPLESVEVERVFRSAKNKLGKPPFLIHGELSAVEIRPGLTLYELGAKFQVGSARSQPDPWSYATGLNPNVSPSDRLTDEDRALIELVYRPYSEELAKLLEQQDIRWQDILPALRRQAAIILERNRAEMAGYWSELGESYRRSNTGLVAYLDFLYFSFVTITTLGYGDILPNTVTIRVLVVLELLTGLGIAVFFVSLVQASKSEGVVQREH